MTDRPILFNDAMVRAILSGAKTQTRRPIKTAKATDELRAWARDDIDVQGFGAMDQSGRIHPCPFGVPASARVSAEGDRLWVRECWAQFGDRTQPGEDGPGDDVCLYRADHPNGFGVDEDGEAIVQRWTPSIHMPRWASRLTLRVTDVRVERVQDITEADARAEGFMAGMNECSVWTALMGFSSTWRDVYGAESWASNPWVWVVSFEREESR